MRKYDKERISQYFHKQKVKKIKTNSTATKN